MDGYALRAADVGPEAWLDVVGTSQAGAGFAGTLRSGQAIRIFTGAPLPQGADTVIMQEEASGTVSASASPPRPPRPLGPAARQ